MTYKNSANILRELQDRLICAIMHSMVATAFASPFNRSPTSAEINEMAKSLVITFPCLKDRSGTHVFFFKYFKTILSDSGRVKAFNVKAFFKYFKTILS